RPVTRATGWPAATTEPRRGAGAGAGDRSAATANAIHAPSIVMLTAILAAVPILPPIVPPERRRGAGPCGPAPRLTSEILGSAARAGQRHRDREDRAL